jgi:hypothetical protein
MTTRTASRMGAILLLALFAALGVRSSLAAVGAQLSPGQHAVMLLQWWYAVLSALAIVGLLAGHPGTRLVLYAWAALFITRSALAPVYIGGKGLGLALAGGAVGLVIAVGILLLAFRSLAPAERTTPP